MKTVLCYGDSNVWGYIPGGGRYSWETRWPGHLSTLLGDSFRVVEEGLNGRTTGVEDPLFYGRDGGKYLPIVLETHEPLDVVIIMLGTNDLKCRLNRTPEAIAQSVSDLLETTRAQIQPSPEIILIAPPHVRVSQNHEINLSFQGALETSQQLSPIYAELAAQFECHFIDAAAHCISSIEDGIHMDAVNHRALAEAVLNQLKAMML